MSRTQAAGKRRWVKRDGRRVQEQVKPGQISHDMMQEWLQREGVELRGGGTDEPARLPAPARGAGRASGQHPRAAHAQALGVAMAGEEICRPVQRLKWLLACGSGIYVFLLPILPAGHKSAQQKDRLTARRRLKRLDATA